jgi:hypothetical protein
LTEEGAVLQSGLMRDSARLFSDADWNAFGALLHNIKTGEPAFRHVNGVNFFDYLSAHPDAQERFDRGMANAANAEGSLIAGAYDFSQYRRIVDVGGGRGGFLAEVLKAHPGPRGVLFDQSQVVERPDFLLRAGVLDRCQLLAGSFFESVPAGADLYILRRVMHDWSDDGASLAARTGRVLSPSYVTSNHLRRKRLSVVAHYELSCSSRALASFRSAVSKLLVHVCTFTVAVHSAAPGGNRSRNK